MVLESGVVVEEYVEKRVLDSFKKPIDVDDECKNSNKSSAEGRLLVTKGWEGCLKAFEFNPRPLPPFF